VKTNISFGAQSWIVVKSKRTIATYTKDFKNIFGKKSPKM
jgi:hypothetical protein